MKTCSSCQNDFNPSSRHKRCPTCREKDKKKTCPECGGSMSRQASTCNSCCLRGTSNPDFQGGTISKSGYVMKRTTGRNSSGYVFEHVLVMEAHLGRELLEGENVHHINGIKDDNRIENLELWTRPQPVGIRAKDALTWARRIIESYEPIADKL